MKSSHKHSPCHCSFINFSRTSNFKIPPWLLIGNGRWSIERCISNCTIYIWKQHSPTTWWLAARSLYYIYYMYYEIFCNRYWQSPTTNCHWVLHRGGLWENFTFLFLQRKLFLIIWPSIDYLHIHLKYSNIYFLSLFSIHFRSIWLKIIWKIYVTIPRSGRPPAAAPPPPAGPEWSVVTGSGADLIQFVSTLLRLI